jgi:hypothetical protein
MSVRPAKSDRLLGNLRYAGHTNLQENRDFVHRRQPSHASAIPHAARSRPRAWRNLACVVAQSFSRLNEVRSACWSSF